MNLQLKFKILERYGSQSHFAQVLGRNDNWISRIVCGRQLPTKEERQLIANQLKIENIDYYLPEAREGTLQRHAR